MTKKPTNNNYNSSKVPAHSAHAAGGNTVRQEPAIQTGTDYPVQAGQPSSTPKAGQISSTAQAGHTYQRAQQAYTPQSEPVKQYKSNELTKKRKKHKGHKHKKRPLKIILIILAVIVGLGLIAALAAAITYNMGKDSIHHENVEFTEGKVVEYNGQKFVYNENVVSTLIIGYDQRASDENAGRSGQADFLLLITLDTQTGKMQGISIPRDTMVPAGEYIGSPMGQNNEQVQICLAYSYGDGRHTSCEYTKNAVSRLLYNMPINNYLALNLEGIGPVNDVIGGVSLTALDTIPNSNIIKGQETTLLGNNARRYVQWRDSYSLESSENRRARQVQYIKEFFAQASNYSSNKIATALNLFNTISGYSCTDLNVTEFSYLAQTVISHGISSFNILAVPGSLVMGETYVEYWPDSTKTYELVLDVFYNKQQ